LVKIPLPKGPLLEGILDLPTGKSGVEGDAVVVCHPHPALGGRMINPLIEVLAQACVSAGFPALRFNFRGVDGSEGKAQGGLIEHEDVAAAAQFLVERGAKRVALVGYSFGALMSLKAIAAGLRPAAFVGIAMPTGVIGDDTMRLGEVERALAAGQPSWLIAGGLDSLCEADRMQAWVAGHPRAQVELLPNEGHTFSLAGTRAVARGCIAHLHEAFS
jgi:uncharacterized protein